MVFQLYLTINIISRIPQDFGTLCDAVYCKINRFLRVVVAAVIIIAIIVAMVVFVVVITGC